MTYSIGRRGSDSRCCQPTAFAMEWIDYEDSAHPGVRDVDAWLNKLAPFAREHEKGRVDELMEAAALGRLEDSGDDRTPIKPVRVDPEIYELRHGALSKKLRFYHGEPDEMPDALVALHHHFKTTDSDQQVHVLHAATRYDEGRASLWGTDNL